MEPIEQIRTSFKLYNSMSRDVEVFTPANPQEVTMYVCGPTVYDTPHIGNARPAVVFDVLFRLLEALYPSVKYARNYTDVDDKIILKAQELGRPISSITDDSIYEYQQLMAMLGVLTPTHEPRATQSIPSILNMIIRLIDSGNAYVVDGHVFFDISSWPDHGVLSGHRQEDLERGARDIKSTHLKRSPGDFVLWKPSPNHPREPGWDSRWGIGRPGWHIECSAMIDNVFNHQTIDIHGGGADLRFPHHECEISQFSACHHKPLARYWMHNGLITVNGKKMAKSEGNFITVLQAAEKYPSEAIRLALMGAHYRSNLDWNDDALKAARQTLIGWHVILEKIEAEPKFNQFSIPILAALMSDLNTPLAIARLHEQLGKVGHVDSVELAAGVRFAGILMGIDLRNEGHETFLRGRKDRQDIEYMIASRIMARKAKDFEESDRLRAQLVSMGLVIEDGPQGTSWRIS